jgi:hypothetical protein
MEFRVCISYYTSAFADYLYVIFCVYTYVIGEETPNVHKMIKFIDFCALAFITPGFRSMNVSMRHAYACEHTDILHLSTYFDMIRSALHAYL